MNRKLQILTIPNKILAHRFQISIKEIFSKPFFLKMMTKYGKSAVIQNVTIVWDPLTCWVWKDVPRQRFLESVLTKSLTDCNLGNALGMTTIFFFKIWGRLQKLNKIFQKAFSVFKIIAFESGVANCHNPEQDTCHRQ